MKPLVIALSGSLHESEIQRLERDGYIVVLEHQQGTVRVETESLRDRFAAAALQGMCADSTHTILRVNARSKGDTISSQRQTMAIDAYEYADAMLAERDKS